ncbi:Ankyrin repeat domain containing protein [Pandoravirus quercus]|uniref:Ankyrin repeat domain containing protein n=1 Tax=Pandoravirus quercus TaxID=2107709 RepID=A0A2U7U8Y2_9VIRU|nr:Ankyrin repeat domain containing protein [Pandoravirus quercus]AVK74901.1 Ankyrin repeat domain containing protein [Pandoravirus quercus]
MGDVASEPATGIPQCLPVELWTHILDKAEQAPEWRFVAARVCQTWRVIVLDSDRIAGRAAVDRGVEVCRMRLARHALAAGEASLLRWALVDACAVPLTPRACGSLWEWTTASGSAACAHVLMDAAVRPPCACGCLGKGAARTACEVLAVVRRAAEGDHMDMLGVLLDRGFMPATCCAYYAMWDAILGERVHMLQFLADRGLIDGPSKTPKCEGTFGDDQSRITWVELAAHSGHTAIMDWLVTHQFDLCGLDMALVRAARNGHVAAVTWICERRHLEHFALAFATALKYTHWPAAEAMLAHKREARVRYEADGDALDQAMARAQKAVDGDGRRRATKLVRSLLAS